jgi:hypothetical protein
MMPPRWLITPRLHSIRLAFAAAPARRASADHGSASLQAPLYTALINLRHARSRRHALASSRRQHARARALSRRAKDARAARRRRQRLTPSDRHAAEHVSQFMSRDAWRQALFLLISMIRFDCRCAVDAMNGAAPPRAATMRGAIRRCRENVMRKARWLFCADTTLPCLPDEVFAIAGAAMPPFSLSLADAS